MTKKILLTLPLLLFFLLAGCKSYHEKFTEQGIHRMSHAELQSLLGNGWDARFEIKSAQGDVSYHSDGSASGQWGGASHKGTWNLDDNKFCGKWDTGDRCTYLYQTEPGVYTLMNLDGSIRGKLTGR